MTFLKIKKMSQKSTFGTHLTSIGFNVIIPFSINQRILQRIKNEIMKNTFKDHYCLKRNAIRKDGRMPIVVRVTVDGVIAQFNTKLVINQYFQQANNK